MTRAEINALRRLAATPAAGAPYGDIPDGNGHLPSGRKGSLEDRLVALRSKGLVEGMDGGQWWITDAGRGALVASAHESVTPSGPPRARRAKPARPVPLPPQRVPVWPR